jgi:hypothetical protein
MAQKTLKLTGKMVTIQLEKPIQSNTVLKGILEIDHNRGVVYFHTTEHIHPTPLRICRIGIIPKDFQQIDIIRNHGVSII